MRSRSWTSLVLALGLLLAAPAALAGRWGAGERGGRGHHTPLDARLEKHLDELGLDDAQREKVRVILDAARAEREGGRERMVSAFESMHVLLEADAPDEAAVLAKADEIGALRNERHKAMLRTLLRVRAELSREQRQKLSEIMRRDGPKHWMRDPGGAREDAS